MCVSRWSFTKNHYMIHGQQNVKLQKYCFFFKYQATYKIHIFINSKFKILFSETFKTDLLRGVRYAYRT
jgi:hypothetical protein